MASRQPLLPDWWGTKHTTILSTVGGALVIVGIIAAVHFSNTWSVDEVDTFLAKGIREGRFPASLDVESLIVKPKAAQIPCVENRQYIVTNIITMEKVDLQFAPSQALTPAKFLGITTGRWNPLQLMKCDIVNETDTNGNGNYVGEVDEDGSRRGVANHIFKSGRYSGQYVNGNKAGIGQYVWKDGNAYLGQYKANKRNGEGKLTLATGESFSGEWVKNEMKGVFTVTGANGISKQEKCSDMSYHPFGCVGSS
eukprot:378365_1